MYRETLRITQSRSPRWLSAVLLIAVFFLPLHFHASTALTSQISKECVCLQGARMQVHSGDTAPYCAPMAAQYAAHLVSQFDFDVQSYGHPSSRAPPALVSL